MNIRISDLKRFRKLSAHIIGSGVLPSSNSIKFGEGVIARASAGAFVIMDCLDSDDDILVDEQVLWGLVDKSTSGFISISSKGNKTTLSDGLYTVPIPKLSVKDYVIIPTTKQLRYPISIEFLKAIGSASEASIPMTSEPNLYMYLHIGQKAVCAGNGFMGVLFPIKEDYKMVLEKKWAALLSKQNIMEYVDAENHYFFYEDGVTFGFTKQEIGYFADFKRLLVGGDEKITFSASKSDIIAFNEMAMSMSKDGGITTISNGSIEMYDSAREIAPRRDLAGVIVNEPFSFRASNMNKAIAPLAAEVLDFYDGKGFYYIRSTETTSTAIIAKILKQ